MQGFIGTFDILGYGNLLENNSSTDPADTAGEVLSLIARAREETRSSIRFGDDDQDDLAAELESRTRWLVFSDRVVFTIRLNDPVQKLAPEEIVSTGAPPSTFVDPEAFILSSSADDSPDASGPGPGSNPSAVQTQAPPEAAEPVVEETEPEDEYDDDAPIALDATLAAMCLMSAVSSASFFQFIMYQAGLPLRGALHFGAFSYEDDAGASAGLAGQGVEDGSELCQRLDLSAVVLSPDAYELAGQFCAETEGLSEILNEEILPYLVPMRSPVTAEKLATVDWLKGVRETPEYAGLDLAQYTYERFWDHGKDIGEDMEPIVQNTIKMLRHFEMMASRERPSAEAEEETREPGWRPAPPGIDLG